MLLFSLIIWAASMRKAEFLTLSISIEQIKLLNSFTASSLSEAVKWIEAQDLI